MEIIQPPLQIRFIGKIYNVCNEQIKQKIIEQMCQVVSPNSTKKKNNNNQLVMTSAVSKLFNPFLESIFST